MRGATFGKPRRFFSMSCFNPRAPCGARRLRSRSASTFCLFQSTRPMRGATTRAPLPLQACHVSIHAPHAGRDDRLSSTRREEKVSIHAPHAGRDLLSTIYGSGLSSFNPRAPCGARHWSGIPLLFWSMFQSTRPMRGATNGESLIATLAMFQSTRPMRGATSRRSTNTITAVFQSTRPMRGATS